MAFFRRCIKAREAASCEASCEEDVGSKQLGKQLGTCEKGTAMAFFLEFVVCSSSVGGFRGWNFGGGCLDAAGGKDAEQNPTIA